MAENILYSELSKPYKAKMLTTADNMFDPFDEFDEWNRFDVEHGYNTCALLARMVDEQYNSRSFNVIDHPNEINEIVDKIVRLDPLNQYIIVVKEITPTYA